MENNLMQTYLLELTEEYEKNKDSNIDELILAKLREKGATEETIEKVKNSFAVIEENNKNFQLLRQAKAEGTSRNQWLYNAITKALSFLGDDNIITKLIKCLFNKIQNTAN